MENLRVLIADDEIEFVTALVERLNLRGIYAEGALRADQAMVKLTIKEFDILLLDIKMPGMSCIDAIDRLLKIRPEVKIILVTGYGSSAEGEDGIKHGAHDLMAKPIKFDDLIVKMNEHMQDING
ncbi:MAG: response regulator [bacterium]|nr:response regulator [bacterium]